MIKNYFKSAWRNTWKNKTTSLINMIGLSVGMTATVLIFLWVQNQTSFDNYKGREHIYRLTTRLPQFGWTWETTPLLLAPAIKEEVPNIESVTRLYTNNQPAFRIGGNLFYEKKCAYVDDDWFKMFPADFKEGNPASFNANPFSIILSSSAAKKYFGDRSAVGQTIHIDTTEYMVKAVVADAPVNSSFQYNVFIPVSALLTNPQIKANDVQWNNANYITFVKTLGNTSPVTLTTQINTVLKAKSNDKDAAPVGLISLANMHFDTEIQNSAFEHGNRNTVYIFSFLGFLLLLIACINYVNLTTAKASLRAREVSIRKIAGASRANLFLQFVAESVIVSVCSLVITLVLLQYCLPLFNQLTGKTFALPLTSTGLWKVLGGALLSALLLNSIYPALLLSSFKPLQVFRGFTVLKVKTGSFRKSLVVLQFTVSVILIAGTIVLYSQMHYIQKTNPGYNRSQVVSVLFPFNVDRAKRQSQMQAFKTELLSQSSIEKVAASNQQLVNLGSMCTGCAEWAGRDTSYNPKIAQLSADADFQATMQLQLKEGRWFRDDDGAGVHHFILNETAVKEFRLNGAVIGMPFIFKGDTGQIIGVVKDFTYKSMHEKTGPLVVFNNPQWRSQFAIRLAAGKTRLALTSLEAAWKKYMPGKPFEYIFLDDSFASLYKQDTQTSILILVFASIAIFISALGLFSLAAFEAEQRTREIGIRKVLGATATGIAALLSKDFVKLVCVAIIIASPIAWWAMDKWLQNFAYRINISWWMFIGAGLLALLIAVCTISTQAIRAALSNPVKSLRTE